MSTCHACNVSLRNTLRGASRFAEARRAGVAILAREPRLLSMGGGLYNDPASEVPSRSGQGHGQKEVDT